MSRRIEKLLLVLGLVCLGVYGGAAVHSRLRQAQARAELAELLRLPGETGSDPRPQASPWSCPPGPARAERSEWSAERLAAFARAAPAGSPLARLEVPVAAVDAMVFAGTSAAALNAGIGHIRGTAPPGSGGNVGLAGHRDGFFRGLRHLRTGDPLYLTTAAGREEYRVEDIAIVAPEAVEVLRERGRPSLTLVTCYPFFVLGRAPRRYVVHAVRSRADAAGGVRLWREAVGFTPPAAPA